MDYKLKAISNDINSDTIADQMMRASVKSKELPPDHICQRTVPVLFSSMRGVHLRKFSRSSTNNYSIVFCDLERWNFRTNKVQSIGLTPPSTSSDKSTTIKSQVRMVEARNNEDSGVETRETEETSQNNDWRSGS